MAEKKEYKSDLKVINVGLQLFHEALVAQDVKTTQLQWTPPIKQDPAVIDALNSVSSTEIKEKIELANENAVNFH